MDTFKWALFSYYIFIGTAQVLLMKASGESAKGTDKGLAYNTASAMIFIEGSKILCCLGVEVWQGDSYRAERGEARRSTTMGGWIVYAVPGFLYAVENNLKIPATVFLHPHVFALFNNSKVIFAAIGMVILLGRKFSVLQWMSMVLLGVSLCVAKVKMLLPAPEPRHCPGDAAAAGPSRLLAEVVSQPDLFAPIAGRSLAEEEASGARFLFGIVLVLAASMISGLAGVFNELLLKKRDADVGLWRKNIWTYQWGVIFNAIGLLWTSRTDSSLNLLRGYDAWVWAMIFVTALLGISVSMIMKYFDNVVKCFGGSLILYSTTLASMVLFGSEVDAGFVLGLVVYSISSYFYAGDHVKKLETYNKFSAEIEAMTKAKAQAAQEVSALAVPADEELPTRSAGGEPSPSAIGRRAAA